MIKTTYKHTEDKNLVWNQYTLFDSPRSSHSDPWSSPVKTYTNKRNIVAHSGLEPATFSLFVGCFYR